MASSSLTSDDVEADAEVEEYETDVEDDETSVAPFVVIS